MSLPLKFLARLLDGWRSPKEVIAPRCLIDGLPMKLVPTSEPTFIRFPDGAKVYRCPDGHEFSPGSYAEGINNFPPNTSGDQHGEI